MLRFYKCRTQAKLPRQGDGTDIQNRVQAAGIGIHRGWFMYMHPFYRNR